MVFERVDGQQIGLCVVGLKSGSHAIDGNGLAVFERVREFFGQNQNTHLSDPNIVVMTPTRLFSDDPKP
jgi:hypothetical protein